jgi:hypothetical protein
MTIRELAETMVDKRVPSFEASGRFRLGQCLYVVVRERGKTVVSNEPY